MREQKWLVSILFLWWLQPCGSQGHKGVKELSPLIVNSSLEPSSPWSTFNDCLSPTLQPTRNLIDMANTIISEHAEMRCIFCHTCFPGFLLGCHQTKLCLTSHFPLTAASPMKAALLCIPHTMLCSWKHHYLQTRFSQVSPSTSMNLYLDEGAVQPPQQTTWLQRSDTLNPLKRHHLIGLMLEMLLPGDYWFLHFT